MKDKKVIVYDRGLYVYLAQRLARDFGKVYYYLADSDPYPCSAKSNIGTGLEGIERVQTFWDYVDDVDLIVFFDVYDGTLQHYLRSKGYNVFGSDLSEKIELDRKLMLKAVGMVGLPVPKTDIVVGLDALEEYLKTSGEKYLKRSYYRGDLETKHFENIDQIMPWIDDLRHKLTQRETREIEILCQDPIPCDCEVGYDGFIVDGTYTKNALTGYEIKDEGYIGAISESAPKVLQIVNQKMSPIYKQLGYRGHYSNEIRITEDKKAYLTDPTCRAPSPPAALMSEIYSNYSEIVWSIAIGEVPSLAPISKYGSEIELVSPDNEDREICVQFPPDLSPFVKLKNHYKKGESYYCVDNGNSGFFGSVICYGDSVEEVTTKCLEYAKKVVADGLVIRDEVFTKAKEAIDAGRKYGIMF